jgi:hypothetical protein
MFITCLVAFSIAARGQDLGAGPGPGQKPAANARVRKVIYIKYADPGRILRLLGDDYGNVKMDEAMKVLTVVGSPEAVESVEETVKILDVPSPPELADVEITAYFLVAKREPSEAANLPSALNDVVAELKRVLSYQDFTLLNSTLIRTQVGRPGSVKGVAGEGNLAADFWFGFQSVLLRAGDKGPIIHLNALNFRLQDPAREGHDNSGQSFQPMAQILTDIDLPMGQKVVVGKTAFGSPDNALILVLTAKVMN